MILDKVLTAELRNALETCLHDETFLQVEEGEIEFKEWLEKYKMDGHNEQNKKSDEKNKEYSPDQLIEQQKDIALSQDLNVQSGSQRDFLVKNCFKAIEILRQYIAEENFIEHPEKLLKLSIENSYLLGRLFFAGIATPKNIKIAQDLFQHVAINYVPIHKCKEPAGIRHALAQHYLAKSYALLRALLYSEEIMNHNYLNLSAYERGVIAAKDSLSGSLYEEEIETLQDAFDSELGYAENGHFESRVTLGFFYQYGLGFAQSIIKALNIYEDLFFENKDYDQFCLQLRLFKECHEHLFLQNKLDNVEALKLIEFFKNIVTINSRFINKIQALLILVEIYSLGKFGQAIDLKYVSELKHDILNIIKQNLPLVEENGRVTVFEDLFHKTNIIEIFGMLQLLQFFECWVKNVENENDLTINSQNHRSLMFFVNFINIIKKMGFYGNLVNLDHLESLIKECSRKLAMIDDQILELECESIQNIVNDPKESFETRISHANSLTIKYYIAYQHNNSKWIELYRKSNQILNNLKNERIAYFESIANKDVNHVMKNYNPRLELKENKEFYKTISALKSLEKHYLSETDKLSNSRGDTKVANDNASTNLNIVASKFQKYSSALLVLQKFRVINDLKYYEELLNSDNLQDKILACIKLINIYRVEFKIKACMGKRAEYANLLEELRKKQMATLKHSLSNNSNSNEIKFVAEELLILNEIIQMYKEGLDGFQNNHQLAAYYEQLSERYVEHDLSAPSISALDRDKKENHDLSLTSHMKLKDSAFKNKVMENLFVDDVFASTLTFLYDADDTTNILNEDELVVKFDSNNKRLTSN